MTDRFLRACRRQPVDRTPLWIMRQAGRYLPEYRALREKVDFLTLCKTPELAVEASLQPLRRFPLDAAIIFSDILLPLEALGCRMTFSPGPRLADPVRTRAQVDALVPRPAAEAVPFVAEAVRLLRRELDGRTPVIGFSGAPFTLAAYLVQGEGKEGFSAVKRMLYREPATLEHLLDTLSAVMADYLRLQIAAGAQAVQIFDSWAGLLGPAEYDRFALRWVRSIVDRVRDLGVPIIYFVNAAPHLVEAAATSGADVLGLCWRTPLDAAAARVGPTVALQGNLDPHALFAEPDEVARQAGDVLARVAGRPGHIMNLGHGILPDTPIASVDALVGAVHAATRRGAEHAPGICAT
ncbi:MAG TPA: uroporphyrinogen decarboxylase [Vicinamibacterales bacterium]|nr:uroporphyrinogen decarboxylase [Vicinamibacterales bacterium]